MHQRERILKINDRYNQTSKLAQSQNKRDRQGSAFGCQNKH